MKSTSTENEYLQILATPYKSKTKAFNVKYSAYLEPIAQGFQAMVDNS